MEHFRLFVLPFWLGAFFLLFTLLYKYIRWFIALSAEDRRTLDEAFKLIIAHNLAAPSVYVHRDFMPRNLMPVRTPATSPGSMTVRSTAYKSAPESPGVAYSGIMADGCIF